MRDRIRPRWKQLSDDALRLVGIADKLAKEEDDDSAVIDEARLIAPAG